MVFDFIVGNLVGIGGSLVFWFWLKGMWFLVLVECCYVGMWVLGVKFVKFFRELEIWIFM